MSLGITIDLRNTATPAVRELAAGLQPRQLHPRIGAAAKGHIQRHLIARDASNPNRLGGTRTHFYARAAKATQWQDVGNGVVVSINAQGIRQRYQGGRITPTKRKYLTIPAISEAHGKRAREFPDLRVQFGRGGVPVALAQTLQTQIKVKRTRGEKRLVAAGVTGGRVVFWLVKEVNQRADPAVLPPLTGAGSLAETVDRAVLSFTKLSNARGASGT